MDCHEASRLVFQYADGELAQELRIIFASHVGACPECRCRARYVQRFLDVLRVRAPRCAAPTRLRVRVLSVLPHRAAPPPASG